MAITVARAAAVYATVIADRFDECLRERDPWLRNLYARSCVTQQKEAAVLNACARLLDRGLLPSDYDNQAQ